MSHPTRGVDHCFVLVNDLDRAAQDYAKMGFTLSPKGIHSKSKGSANYTIMFPDDYFELLGMISDTDLNKHRREQLDRQGQGLHAVACRIGDAEEAERELTGLGIETYGLGSFERPVAMPDGTHRPAAFSTLVYAPQEVPRGIVFMCQHKTPETVWIPELLEHANTAIGLGAILAISDNPKHEAPGFARLWADGSVMQTGQVCHIATGVNSAPLLLMNRAEMQALYPGFDLDQTAQGAFTALRIKVRDMAATRACLSQGGLTPTETKAGLALTPQDGAGTIIEFVSA